MAWSLNELRNPALRAFFEKIFGGVDKTAAKKVNIEAEDATTGISKVEQGTTAIPQVLNTNPGAAVIGQTLNILHSAGAGDCADLIGSYQKAAVSGDGDSGLTLVGAAQRAYVGTALGTTVAQECYGDQPWAKHLGTGAIKAMSGLSAKLDVGADNFTANNSVNAGHFHIDGAAIVTSPHYDGVMIEAYPDVTSLDSMLKIAVDSGASVESAIHVAGAATDFVKFAADGSGGATTSDPGVGDANAWIKCHIGNTVFWLIGYADTN